MDFRSLSDKILVKDVKTDTIIGGLKLSASTATLTKAEVFSVGDECLPSITVGSIILYQKDNAEEISFEGEYYKMLRQKDIWTKINM